MLVFFTNTQHPEWCLAHSRCRVKIKDLFFKMYQVTKRTQLEIAGNSNRMNPERRAAVVHSSEVTGDLEENPFKRGCSQTHICSLHGVSRLCQTGSGAAGGWGAMTKAEPGGTGAMGPGCTQDHVGLYLAQNLGIATPLMSSDTLPTLPPVLPGAM